MNQQYKIMIENLKVQLVKAKAMKQQAKTQMQMQITAAPKEKKAMLKQQMLMAMAQHDRTIAGIQTQIANTRALAARMK